MKTCLHCGKLFAEEAGGRKEKKFCSRSCGTAGTVVTRTVVCVDCGISVTHIGRGRRLRCPDCMRKHNVKRQTAFRVRKGIMKHPGVGSGGAQWGEDNHRWKPGDQPKTTKYTGDYRTRCLRLWGTVCVVCGSENNITAHHVDGDYANYADSNLVSLCESCHKKVHRKRKQTVEQCKEMLFTLWPSGRIKIAERTGTPSSGQPERK
jgi:hypothetical protein